MFSLDDLFRAVPSYQVAGRLGIDVVAWLSPIDEAMRETGARLYPLRDLAWPLNLNAVFRKPAPASFSRSALRDHVLVVRVYGEFRSTDELALSHIDREHDRWSIELDLIRFEDLNIDPAPRNLWLVMSIEVGNYPLRSLALRFCGRCRDFQGNEKAMQEPVAPSQAVEFVD